MNSYLDIVEGMVKLKSSEMISFINTKLYPYLRDNVNLIVKTEHDAFKKLKIFISRVKVGKSEKIVRESLLDGGQWYHSDKGESLLSINRYRVFESSPVNIGIIGKIADEVLEGRKLYVHFGEKNQQSSAKRCHTWEEVKDYIEATLHFGYKLGAYEFPCLKKYVLSKKLSPEFNVFRETGILMQIEDRDVAELSSFFDNSISATTQQLIRMGIRTGRDFFLNEGSYLSLTDDIIKVFESELYPSKVFDEFRAVKKENGKYINTTYSIIKSFDDRALLFFLDRKNELFPADLYKEICNQAQEDRKYWDRTDSNAVEILIRAISGASAVLHNKEKQSLKVSIQDVLSRGLEDCIVEIESKKAIGRLEITNEAFFERIPDEEIIPRLLLLKYEVGKTEIAYFKGNLACFGGEKKYLRDVPGGNVYLKCDANGDYNVSLEEMTKKHFDIDALRFQKEMEHQYKGVKEQIIVPLLNKADHDLNRAYIDIESSFKDYDKKQIISILSWFRSQGYTNALGNGNINTEKEIEDDYRDDPWKFIYEFIQNVDDCSYKNVEHPELDIVIDDKKNNIIFEYNEDGFTLEDVKALTKFGDSNKRGLLDKLYVQEGAFDLEKTGRKGRGVKSVFALPGSGIIVHVFSNGYKFKFVKRLGTIIPIWEDVDDSPKIGTRIIVEGFEVGYIAKLVPQIRKMFGVDDITEFFAVCPILYLRKLRRVSVACDESVFSVDISVKDRTYTRGDINIQNNPVSGIIHEGSFQQEMWENDIVTVSISDQVKVFPALRNCRVIGLGDEQRIASIFAPIMNTESNMEFKKGALYCTLPLNEHILPIPISINAPFDTDSGRSALAENSDRNGDIAKVIFDLLLKNFFIKLRAFSDISIEKYIPSRGAVILEGYKSVSKVELSTLIRTYPVLRSYIGDNYVSCKEAIVLSDECYQWVDPVSLAKCFEKENLTLVEQRYSGLPGVKRIELCGIHFVESLNMYLEKISIDNELLVDLLREYIYPYIDEHYEMIRKSYRTEGKQDDLRNMQIFMFRMSDGGYVRESAENNNIWMKEVPDGYLSFGKYRSVDTGSISDIGGKSIWIKELHEIVSFNKAFTKDVLDGAGVRDWIQTEELVGTVLYYNVKRNMQIPYLGKCVLSEEYDQEDNLFRKGYVETGFKGIIDRIIDESDLTRIRNAAGADEIMSLQEVADSIKTMGIKQASEFFDSKGRGIYALNSSALALLREYCNDRIVAGKVLSEIDKAFIELKKNNKGATLHITYDDIKDCSPAVFLRIFEYEIAGGDIRNVIAREYCDNFRAQSSDDSAEAYIRALEIIGTTQEVKSITLRLSQIKDRCLGKCLQNCKVINPKKLNLIIVTDLETYDYPSDEIDKALKWLDDENAVSVSYEYYTTDLKEAFGYMGDTASFFLFDDSKVLLDTSNADNCMLRFVQKRYKGSDDSFRALISIIMEQNELKKPWGKTKREYVEKLAKFRKDTLAKQKVLFPNYDRHLNDANGKAVEYVIPELLQNINDCVAREGQNKRTLDVSIDIKNGTMLLCYDEAGFNFENVYSITAIGQSSKHDESEGEKGLGFKKVFSLFECVEIYSNGFCFLLRAEENTVPQWIDDKQKQNKYLIEGKTTMLFSVDGINKKRLSGILEQWSSLVNGEFVGTNISPLFLKNIDYIHLDGCDNFYSREAMEKEFVFFNAPLLSFYVKLIEECEIDDPEQLIADVRSKLKLRRKCALMDSDEQERYVDSLSVEICIPKRIRDKNKGRGCFYSTLPIQEQLFSSFFINLPLELTTGRDGLIEESIYNKTVFRMLFAPVEESTSVFGRIVEILADNHRELFLLNYIMPDVEPFAEKIGDLIDEDVEDINAGLEELRIFKAFGNNELVSLVTSYSVDRIIYQYINEVGNSINNIEGWLQVHSNKTGDLSLLKLSTVDECEKVERFANYVETTDGYFPLVEHDIDLMIEYMSDEYGREGGDEDDE